MRECEGVELTLEVTAEESSHGIVEGRRLFEICHVARLRDPDQLGARNRVMHVDAQLRRRQRVFLPDDDERRKFDG